MSAYYTSERGKGKERIALKIAPTRLLPPSFEGTIPLTASTCSIFAAELPGIGRQMKAKFRSLLRILIWLLCLLLLSLAIFASRGPVEHLWLNAPGWSRARLVGHTQLDHPVPIALDDRGDIYLFLIRADGEALRPQAVALGRQMEVVWQRTLEAALSEPENPQILWDGKELHLFWLSDQSLYTARLDRSGYVTGSPTLISGDTEVDTYDVAHGTDGPVTAWYAGSRREPGLYALPPGDPTGEATLVEAAGVQPVLRYDGSGTLHAVWVAYPPPGQGDPCLYYTAYPGGIYRPQEPIRLIELDLGVRSTWQGPWIGLEQGQGYVLWTEIIYSGRGLILDTKYLSFALDGPLLTSEVNSIAVPGSNDLSYQILPGGHLKAGPRASLTQHPGTVSPSNLAVNSTFESELALAFRTQVQYRHRSTAGQISTLFLQDGLPAGYQLLSFTPSASFAPAIVSDGAGQLYVTWLERSDTPGFAVYLASTAPDIQATLRAVTRGDLGRIAVATIFGLLSGLILAPVATLLWFAASAVVLALTWAFRRGGESITAPSARISLVLAFVAYWAAKLFTLAGVLTHVPFSAWIPGIPSWLKVLLQLGVPIVVAAVAIRIAWRCTVRSQTRSTLVPTAIYTAIDSALTMAIYGEMLYDLL